ncbi:MAG TPA: cell wall protein, partial [Firmicutes bacterium]|nr:cell wall protein [Bacillota bacterium]
MKNARIELKLKTAVEHSVPDVLDNILSQCEEQKGVVIPMPQAKKKNKWKSL